MMSVYFLQNGGLVTKLNFKNPYPSMEGHWKFLGGGGSSKRKFKKPSVKYEAKLEFLGLMGCKTKTLPWGCMDIF